MKKSDFPWNKRGTIRQPQPLRTRNAEVLAEVGDHLRGVRVEPGALQAPQSSSNYGLKP